MKKHIFLIIKILPVVTLTALLVLSVTVPSSILAKGPPEGKGPGGGGHTEVAGNNLSFPVIWAEGVTKNLPGEAGDEPYLDGAWWYWWGMEGEVPLSCPPDPDDPRLCDDGVEGSANGDSPGEGWVRAYLQKDESNIWQAGSDDWSASDVEVDWIDWGDNLESVDWYTRSQVRTEVVLFQDLASMMLEYGMRHVSGWGIDEVHGLACSQDNVPEIGDGKQATVYSHCARLTIQKLLVDRDDTQLENLTWVPGAGWTGEGLINTPIFNMAVHEGGDGPGAYSAEINVKGRIIYGYTWNVRNLNDDTPVPPDTVPTAAGDYRITFSFDEECDTALNTFFVDGETQILVSTEEELAAAATEEEPGGGGVAVLDCYNNLTYIDIRILPRTGGGGGGHGGGGSGGGGHRR